MTTSTDVLGIVFIDSRVPDIEELLAGLEPGQLGFVIDPTLDGLEQIAEILAANGYSGLASVSIVAHGADGRLQLGASWLSDESLSGHAAALQTLGAALSADGDLLLYACDVASGAGGRQFIGSLAGLTGADVAASDDITGSMAHGGDWDLEASTGAIEASNPFSADAIAGFGGALAGPLNGQLWYLVGGEPNETGAGHVNSNGSNPTLPHLNAEGQTSIGLDLPAGYYYTVSTDHLFLEAHRVSDGVKIQEIQIADHNGAGSMDDDLTQAVAVDPINEYIYVSRWGETLAESGVVRVSYNPLTGMMDASQAYNASQTRLVDGTDPGAMHNARYFDLDGNFLYFVDNTNQYDDATFDPRNGVYRIDLTNPSAGATLLSSQVQFPTNESGGYISSVAADSAKGLIYFTTHGATNAAKLWYMPIAGGTATEVGLPGGTVLSIGDYPNAGLTLDPQSQHLYVTIQSNIPQGFTFDGILQGVLSADGHSITSWINTYPLTTLAPEGGSLDPNAHVAGTVFNLLPVLSVTQSATNAVEQGGGIDLTNAFTSPDADNDHLRSATVQITGGTFTTPPSNESSANDDHLYVLDGVTQRTTGTITGTNITVSYTIATETLTLSGYDTVANYQAALNAVGYFTTGDNPTNYGNNPTRTITWTVSDGAPNVPTGGQNSGTTTLNIAAVNDAPVNVVPGAESGLEDTLFGINGISVSDVDADPANDDITVTLSVGSGVLTVRTDVALGLVVGDIAGNGTDVVIITATQNQINATFANATGIQYQGDLNFFGTDTFQLVTNDVGQTGSDPGLTGNGTSEADTDSFQITVTAVNDAPTGTPEDRTINEDQTYVFTLADFADGFSDTADNPAPNSLNRVQVTTLASDGMLMFDADGASAGPAVAVTLLQFISAADITAGKFFFVPSANENDTTDYATFDFKLEDNGGVANSGQNLSAAYAFTFDVNPVNDAPVVVGVTETLGAILEDDPDPAGATVSALFAGHFDDSTDNSVSSTANNFAGVAVTAIGAGGGGVWQVRAGGSWVDIGAISESSAMLLEGAAELRFLPDANFNGPAPSLTVRLVDDSSGAIVSGAFADVSTNGAITPYSGGTIALGNSVTAVNDEPSGTDNTVTTNEDTAYTFTAADFGFLDGADGDDLLAVTITTIPADDRLELNGVAVTAGQSISITDINAGDLKFVPGADENGAGYGSFTFQVQDDGGVLSGGVDLDQTANTMTIDVTAVNDAPAGTDNTVTGVEDTDYVFAAADFGFTDPDDTPANALLAVVITTLPIAGSLELNGVAVTAGQSVSVADVNGGLLTYTPGAEDNGPSSGSFTFQVQDDGGGTDLDGSANTLTINLSEVNDAPEATDDVLASVDEDAAPITISFAELLGDDFKGPPNEVGQTLDIIDVTNVVGGSAQIVGTDVVFTLDANFNGTASFDYTIEDDGTTDGVADPLSDVGSASFTVNPINDAPQGADNTVSTVEDTEYTFAAADFGFSDPADTPADDLLAVEITALPGPGSLELDGVAVTAGQSISLTDINAGKLKYTPGLNAFAAAYASFGFRVQDDGGVAGGGDDLDDTERFITIDVTAADDDPTVDQGIGDTFAHFDESFSFTFAADAFEDIDGDTLTYTAEIDGGGALPAWLTFTSATRQFSGTPAEADVGTLSIRVTASDGAGTTASTVFDLDVLGDLVLFGTAHSNLLTGHHGDDTLTGRGSSDTLMGAQGKDRLDGNNGDDLLQGGGGGDKLQGAAGSDTLIGGTGRDVYRGGLGADTFVYDDGEIPVGPPKETIRDYQLGIDTIDLSAIDANGAGPGDTAFTWLDGAKFTGVAGEATFKVVNLGVILMMDLNGDEIADLQINILGATDIDAGDMVL